MMPAPTRTVEGMLTVSGGFRVRLRRADGRVEEFERSNIVTNEGINALLASTFAGFDPGPWHIGLKLPGDFAPEDTMRAHPGWLEFTGYAGMRPVWSGQPNGLGQVLSTTPAQFKFTAQGEIAGSFVTNAAQKGGADGSLYSVADFDFSRVVYPGDALDVLYFTRLRR